MEETSITFKITRKICNQDPDIFNNVDVQIRSSFMEHNISSPASFAPETTNFSIAKKPWLISQVTGQPKWVKNKAPNKRKKIAQAPCSNTEALQKLADIMIKEEKEDTEEEVFRRYLASELKELNILQKKIVKEWNHKYA